MNPLVIIELVLKIWLQILQDQPPEVKARLWELYLKDLEWWRTKLKIDVPE